VSRLGVLQITGEATLSLGVCRRPPSKPDGWVNLGHCCAKSAQQAGFCLGAITIRPAALVHSSAVLGLVPALAGIHPPPHTPEHAKVGISPDSPTGDDENAEVDEMNRRMLAIRQAKVRAMIASGDVPHGYLVDDAGTGFARKGNPAWPLRPLDPFCFDYGEPSLELTVLIQKLLPDFDPESDKRWWLQVAELVRRAGRTSEEVAAMGCDELVAFFRIEVFGVERESAIGEAQAAAAKPSPDTANVTTDVAAEAVDKGERSTSQILREWLGDPERKLKLAATLSSERAGRLIGRAGSSVREAGDAWDDLKAEFKTYRAVRRYERKRRRQ